MLIGICGAKCAGKSTVAQYLVEHHGFTKLYLEPSPVPEPAEPASGASAGGTTTDPRDGDNAAAAALPSRPRGAASDQQEQQRQTFASADALLDFVTRRWRERWVTTDVRDEAVLDTLGRRPFFLLLSVDAPVLVRWRRYQHKQQQQRHQDQQQEQEQEEGGGEGEEEGEKKSRNASSSASTSTATTTTSPISDLETFVAASDAHLYSPSSPSSPSPSSSPTCAHLSLMSLATVRLINASSSLPSLHTSLSSLSPSLLDPSRLRPSWDAYFMSLASLAARRCNCMKRAVGCVLVDASRHAVLATGYNGTPRRLPNCADGGCARCNAGGTGAAGRDLDACLCLHAEENALLEAGRGRLGNGNGNGNGNGQGVGGEGQGCVLYCNTCPCLTCSIKIVQVGIGEVVYSQAYSMDGEAARIFRAAGVKLRQFSPPANGLIHLENLELR
ncbi:cytidine deaminase-like protein [Xylariaceae sp. FL0804]|nr:cytidine deaminase-like protein [Xylariaceae sp. FL0804]